MIRRQRATEATLRKYRERALDWRGRTSCVHMARYHLRQMGHRPPPMLDAVLPEGRIAPLEMRLGDLAVVRGTHGLDAILLHAGNEALGWPEDGSRIVPMIVHE
ncbi:hypothetical protein [uncultured Croceicoccus sp.]|uniref:hypothetical protein n=1 Tax=uncultured Croceicoccus sp. TaxID=1295329 RepID=UPI002625EA5E|nr:hypothetical protein [uncultured Croceicoccus sp.]